MRGDSRLARNFNRTFPKMKRLAIILCLFALVGCHGVPAKVPPVVSAPVIASQEGKDTAILSEAAQIDAIAPAAKPHTDAQRAAVAAAPAADVARLAKAFDSQIADLLRDNTEKDKQIADMKDAELKKQTAWLRWIGLGAIAVAGLLAWSRQLQFAAVSALVGLTALGLAQLISQPWFMPAVSIASGLALAAVGFIGYRKYQKDTLARSIAVDAERMKGALTTIVPAIDSALASLDSAAQTVVKSALSRAMDSDHKTLVKEIKAAI
jgi:membrane protein implicated in regulation of membrane protease activity